MTEIERVDISTGELVDEFGAVQLARNAWVSIKTSGSELRQKWLILATGLDVGRKKYTTEDGGLNKKEFGRWCDREGFSDLSRQDRGNALWFFDNVDSIVGNPYITFNAPTDMRKQYRALEKKEKREQEIADQVAEIEASDVPVINRKYHVISIDPPWPYEGGKDNSYDAHGRRVANPYPEMSIEDIAALEMPATDDSILWLWTTHRFLPDAFALMGRWGFDYKATMVWNKQKIGMGHWLRMQCEFCLLGVRGNPIWEAKDVRDIIEAPRREHSRKPDEFFDMVDRVCIGAKLEYFSREQREGWDQVGNDTEKF